MYTAEGIISGTGPRKELVKWDYVRCVKLRGGQRVTRHVLRITKPLYAIMTGLGGISRLDVGRLLVVDRGPDGEWIAAFALPGQEVLRGVVA